jgi:hypothetical protein
MVGGKDIDIFLFKDELWYAVVECKIIYKKVLSSTLVPEKILRSLAQWL